MNEQSEQGAKRKRRGRGRRRIRCGSNYYPVTKDLTISGRTYHVVNELGGQRKRYQVVDPRAGPDGDMRAIHILPNVNKKRLHVFKRLAESNRNIPAIIEYHQAKGRVYLVLPWIWGTDLRRYLREVHEGKRMYPRVREVFFLFRGFAHGLTQYHHRGFVHGDLKPDNLILCREPNRLVMIDFGSAWLVSHTMQRDPGDGITLGKYLAPEQVQLAEHSSEQDGEGSGNSKKDSSQSMNKPGFVDVRCDQFSFSVMFYEMLTMELPYANLGGLVGLEENRELFKNELVPASKKSRDRNELPLRIWNKIDHVIAKGLALDPDHRYPSRTPWLRDFDDIYAELKSMSPISPVNQAFLKVFSWATDLFGFRT